MLSQTSASAHLHEEESLKRQRRRRRWRSKRTTELIGCSSELGEHHVAQHASLDAAREPSQTARQTSNYFFVFA